MFPLVSWSNIGQWEAWKNAITVRLPATRGATLSCPKPATLVAEIVSWFDYVVTSILTIFDS